MAYVPPHKRTYSKNHDQGSSSSSSSQISVPPTPELPPSLFNKALKFNSPGTSCSSNNGHYYHEIRYAYADIFKWFAVGLDNDHNNHFPPSLYLQPVLVESGEWKIVKRQALFNSSVHDDLTTQNFTRRSPWEYIAENLVQDLLSSIEDLSSKMEFQTLVEAKPTLVAKFGKVLFLGKPFSVDQKYVTTTNLLSEDLMRPLRRAFYTSIPNSYVEYITKEAASKNGLEFDKDKEAYLLFFTQEARSEDNIYCKCILKEDGKLHLHKIKHGHVRHMLRDISCLEKNMDMRLDLGTKKAVTALADDDMRIINDLIDSAILDKEVRGGLRWPSEKSSVSGDNKLGVTSVWHVTSKIYKSPSLKLKIKDIDRYRFWSSIGQVLRKVDIVLKDVASELMKEDVDRNLISEMLKDDLKVLWNDFLCCEQFP